MVIGIAGGLSACGMHSDLPAFSASGYVADQGVVRLWRKDDDQHRPVVLMSVYSPYHGPVQSPRFTNIKMARCARLSVPTLMAIATLSNCALPMTVA